MNESSNPLKRKSNLRVKILFSIGVCALLLGGVYGAVKLMAKFRPVAQETERPKLIPTVRVLKARATNEVVELSTQGLVEAARHSMIASEVSGRVTKVADQFKVGERFDEGEWMVQLEDADFKAALVQAQATLAEAESALASEKARAMQAEREWKKLSGGQSASELVLRKPQVASAEARVKAAAGGVEKARRDLERTRIVAPFAGRVRSKKTDLGAYLTPGAPVAELSSVGRHEVRLPISLGDLSFLPKGATDVSLFFESGGKKTTWAAEIVRTEGEVERSSRSIYLVAEAVESGESDLLQPGLFVKAKVRGVELKSVFRIPRSAFLDADRLIVIDDQNLVRHRKVNIIRADGDLLLVSSGLEDGDQICLTMLTSPVEGMEVRVLPDSTDSAVSTDLP